MVPSYGHVCSYKSHVLIIATQLADLHMPRGGSGGEGMSGYTVGGLAEEGVPTCSNGLIGRDGGTDRGPCIQSPLLWNGIHSCTQQHVEDICAVRHSNIKSISRGAARDRNGQKQSWQLNDVLLTS